MVGEVMALLPRVAKNGFTGWGRDMAVGSGRVKSEFEHSFYSSQSPEIRHRVFQVQFTLPTILLSV
jgi:hypothetical protein